MSTVGKVEEKVTGAPEAPVTLGERNGYCWKTSGRCSMPVSVVNSS